jgi:hypothetical protein
MEYLVNDSDNDQSSTQEPQPESQPESQLEAQPEAQPEATSIVSTASISFMKASQRQKFYNRYAFQWKKATMKTPPDKTSA